MLNMRILTRILAQLKIPFFTAGDGIEAVEQFSLHRPSLILLDINMPRMSGYEASKQIQSIIKADQESEDSWHFVAAITALSDDYSRSKGLDECGMDAWYSKPLDISKFKKNLIKWFVLHDGNSGVGIDN